MLSLKFLGFTLIIIGSILELIEVKFEAKSRVKVSVRFRRKDLTACLSGTLFAIVGSSVNDMLSM